MGSKLKSRRRMILVAIALAVAGVGASIAYAAIPGVSGTINGCYEKRTGILRVIDAEAGKACLSIETPISWSQRGEKGDQGLQGLPGPKGDKGDKGDPGAPAPLYTAGRGLELNGTEFRLAFDPAEVAQLQQQVAQLLQGFDELQKQNAGQANQLATLGGRLDGVKIDVEAQLTALGGAVASGLGGLGTRLDSLQSEFNETKARVDTLKAWACGVDPKGAAC
jgi:hypothetical protein